MQKNDRIYVAGHRGLVGTAILRRLQAEGYSNLVVRSRQELDLMRQDEVETLFETEKPEYVFLAAAKVGGILANNRYPAEFIYQNLLIESNVIHSAYASGVKKLLFLGSSCIYPRDCPQPMKEEYLLSGKLEPTNEPYAIAKIAGIKMCQSYNRQYGCRFILVMPTNLYGPGDNFDLETSHVLPALIRKFHEAKASDKSRVTSDKKTVTLWGTGTARREFLHVDDLADACLFLMDHYDDSEIINIGVGKDISISEVADLIKDIVGFKGTIQYDRSKPDGTPRKLLDVSKLESLGWQPKISLREGVEMTYRWYVDEDARRTGRRSG
ncbi:MAG: NAD-dependent epimerase/dehydratase [Deltaproteobacteria bacterium]|nr:NAD-dependent epimerase/dehydratase [Deltaproteobacteria bacterium]